MSPDDEARALALLREGLPASGAGIYLAAHVAGPLPAETAAAMADSDELELRLGRVGPERADDLAQRDEEARAVLAAVLGTSPERLVLTHGSAEGARLAAIAALAATRARAVDFADPAGPASAGRFVLVGALAPAVRAALVGVAEAVGAACDVVPVPPDRLPSGSRLVAAPLLDTDGVVLDAASLAAAARESGAWLLLDASLAAGAIAVDPGALGARAVVVDGHRWLLGPEGVAGLWLAPEVGREAPNHAQAAVGAFARSTLLGLARSVGWLLMYVGVPWVIARTGALAARLRTGLAAIEGVTVCGGERAVGPVVAFRIDGWTPLEAADELAHRRFAILEADAAAGVLRASVGAWLRDEDLARFVAGVAELAGHAPGSLPRRPPLAILHAGAGEA